MSTIPRLFVRDPLHTGASIQLEGGTAHYIVRVMRLSAGDGVRVFNGRDGEWLTEIVGHAGKTVNLRVKAERRAQQSTASGGLHLFFAPLKKTRTDFIVEKATEMGVNILQPVMTARTQTKTVRTDRLRALSIEAAEQTERMDVPQIKDAVGLRTAMDDWLAPHPIFFCDEAGDDETAIWGGEAGRALPLAALATAYGGANAGVLIGPEGGFAPDERTWLRSLDFVRPVSLGPRILRAETAVVAALAIWQALAGDWQAHMPNEGED